MRKLTKRFSLVAGLTAVVVLAGAAPASAGTSPISVNDDIFNPDLVEVSSISDCGLTWDWGTVSNSHNVRQDSKLFYSGAPTDDDSNQFFRVCSAGTMHYYCEVHGF